jgi:hypothetical protein
MHGASLTCRAARAHQQHYGGRFRYRPGGYQLEVGTAQQTVEVQANADQLQTEDAKMSVTVTDKPVDQLPPFDLASLPPEAKNVGGDYGFTLGGGQVRSQVRGRVRPTPASGTPPATIPKSVTSRT